MSTNVVDNNTQSQTPMDKINLDLTELDAHELALLQSQTGIQDIDELKRHVEDVAERAFKARSKFVYQPIYKHVLELGKTRKDAIFLDIGCALGHDTRKVVADGYPVQNVVASDLQPEFWTLGHELFKSTPETFPVPFIPGNALDEAFIPDCSPFDNASHPPSTEKPTQSILTSSKSLAPLQGHVSAIHVSALFHLFGESQQRVLARKIGSLLSPEPGSVIFGIQRGFATPGEHENPRGEMVFWHSVESWKKLWVGGEGEEGVYPKGMVEVDATLWDHKLGSQEPNRCFLVWSVKRVE
ncbi:hypothetical protein D9758_012894 [Tetrapyrgos nigripes]|uniref:Methyltransferase domain-containing protein n=1 Tax=Tetrapyrgos nigripes TaxID=182062 RepID=A0A8H5CNA9_9AGAR|nr:hypothetical protein D9758_012894 [Tetrapyrgos nigripes]